MFLCMSLFSPAHANDQRSPCDREQRVEMPSANKNRVVLLVCCSTSSSRSSRHRVQGRTPPSKQQCVAQRKYSMCGRDSCIACLDRSRAHVRVYPPCPAPPSAGPCSCSWFSKRRDRRRNSSPPPPPTATLGATADGASLRATMKRAAHDAFEQHGELKKPKAADAVTRAAPLPCRHATRRPMGRCRTATAAAIAADHHQPTPASPLRARFRTRR